MALKKCKECGADVSSSADACPNCGKKLKRKHPILGAFIFIIGIVMVFGAMGGASQPSSTNTIDTNVVINRENYDKIEKGMTMDEVKAILGEPTLVSESEVAGITTILHHYQLPLTTTAIEIYYTNNIVSAKNYVEL